MLGNEIKTLVNNEKQNSGSHEVMWDGTNNAGTAVSSGVYFYKLASADFSKTLKMLLIK